MQGILEELYMGNVGFDVGFYGPGSPFVAAAKKKANSMNELLESLEGREKQLFEQYCEAQSDLEDITRYDTFAEALRFGILFMTEIYTG